MTTWGGVVVPPHASTPICAVKTSCRIVADRDSPRLSAILSRVLTSSGVIHTCIFMLRIASPPPYIIRQIYVYVNPLSAKNCPSAPSASLRARRPAARAPGRSGAGAGFFVIPARRVGLCRMVSRGLPRPSPCGAGHIGQVRPGPLRAPIIQNAHPLLYNCPPQAGNYASAPLPGYKIGVLYNRGAPPPAGAPRGRGWGGCPGLYVCAALWRCWACCFPRPCVDRGCSAWHTCSAPNYHRSYLTVPVPRVLPLPDRSDLHGSPSPRAIPGQAPGPGRHPPSRSNQRVVA